MTSLTGSQGFRGMTGGNLGGNRTGSFKQKIPEGYSQGSVNNYTPEQQQLFQQQFGHTGPDSYLSKLAGGDQSMFGEIEAPVLKQFSELQGSLASRFSGMGGLGARKSSGFQNAGNQAASDFAMQLQQNRQGLQRQALSDLMGFSNQLLGQRPQNNFLIKKQQKQGFNWGGLAGGALGGIGGFFAGGPMGAMSGAGLGYNIGSGLSGQGGGGDSMQFQSSPGWDMNEHLPIWGNV